jgi:hypothetical protein
MAGHGSWAGAYTTSGSLMDVIDSLTIEIQ